jgi:superfamily I DNA/RNA helicase
MLVVAGPGSGKTRALTHRLAYLVAHEGVAPERCLAITFTRRAARELRERLDGLLPDRAAELTVCTLHQLGLGIVSEHAARLGLRPDFQIADEPRVEAVLGERFGLSAAKARARRLAASRARRLPPAELGPEDRAGLDEVRGALRAEGLVDFDDLIALPVELLEAEPELVASYRARFGWIFIDELQDVDGTQYRLLRGLASPEANLCAIGDPDQSIYGFRGAEPDIVERFVADWPTARRFELGRNYRSDGFIVKAAAELIGSADDRVRCLEAVLPSGHRLVLREAPSERAEAELVVQTLEQLLGGHSFFSLDTERSDGRAGADFGFSDFAVLYRTDAQAEPLCEALQRSGIPFQRRSHVALLDDPMARALVGEVLADALGGSVHARLRRAVETLLGREGTPTTVHTLAEELAPLAAGFGDDVGGWQRELALAQSADGWDPRADRVSLLTLHASKGLEFPVVLLVGCEEGLLPLRWGPKQAASLDEERRLLYVGMTRARERLHLSWAAARMARGKLRQTGPSPLLRSLATAELDRARVELPARTAEPPSPQLALFGPSEG